MPAIWNRWHGAIREGRPTARIVIAADDDCETDGNPDLTAARKAADAVRGHVAIPTRQPPNGKKLDFNDLHAAEGSETVAAIVVSAFTRVKAAPPRRARADQRQLAGTICRCHRGVEREALCGRDGWRRPGCASIDRDEELERDRLVFSREADIKLLYGNRRYMVSISKVGRWDFGRTWAMRG